MRDLYNRTKEEYKIVYINIYQIKTNKKIHFNEY